MDFVSGEILTKNGSKKGYIGFENRTIVETGKGIPPKKPVCKGLIVPKFVNVHTHIGDSFIREKNIDLPKNIEDLVAPPNGLKHKLLHETTDEEIIEGMEKSLDQMIKSGTKYFCDFREDGILGISQLKTALQLWKISSIILSSSILGSVWFEEIVFCSFSENATLDSNSRRLAQVPEFFLSTPV